VKGIHHPKLLFAVPEFEYLGELAMKLDAQQPAQSRQQCPLSADMFANGALVRKRRGNRLREGERVIYHILTERELFSADVAGGAVSRSIANILPFDDSSTIVCRGADDSWNIESNRILILPALRSYSKIRGRGYLPLRVKVPLLRRIFQPFLAQLDPDDIVWCHGQPDFCVALEPLIHRRGAKLVCHMHSSLEFFARRPHFRRFIADAYIFVSASMQKEALQLFPWLRNTYAIHNGADESLFYPRKAQFSLDLKPIILYVGRIVPEKGVHVLIDAMRILEERRIVAECRVVGNAEAAVGGSSSYLRTLLESSPATVQFVGSRPGTQIAEEYRQADILCCPSIYEEPFGNVNIEAMGCAVPVVASRVGGIPEIAADGGVILVSPNSPAELADALQALIQDSDFRVRTGRDGLASFRRRFTWHAITTQYRRVADSLVRTAIAGGQHQ
jgi:glycosyltransferase involved in cell wall biosynthesis